MEPCCGKIKCWVENVILEGLSCASATVQFSCGGGDNDVLLAVIPFTEKRLITKVCQEWTERKRLWLNAKVSPTLMSNVRLLSHINLFGFCDDEEENDVD